MIKKLDQIESAIDFVEAGSGPYLTEHIVAKALVSPSPIYLSMTVNPKKIRHLPIKI